MSHVMQAPSAAPAEPGNRVVKKSLLRAVLSRPEGGALIAAVALFIVFWAAAPTFRTLDAMSTVLYQSSTLGIMAVGVALLMIGGEFDLSTGVAVITAGLTAAMISYQLSLNLWVGTFLALALSLIIGFINGYLVIKTGIHSFLVTLAMFFSLAGLNLAVTKAVTGTVTTPRISDMDGYGSLRNVFGSSFSIGGLNIRITVVYWLVLVALATWVLLRTKIGNWIFASGGDPASARAVGVPVTRVKIGLFMTVGFMAWFFGMHRLYAFNSVQSGEGVGNELLYIVVVVVGGCLLTGGYGSAIGAAIGAFIFGMTQQGIIYAGWDADLYRTFLGLMLLLAVMLNIYIKKRSTGR